MEVGRHLTEDMIKLYWEDSENYKPQWAERAKLTASYIDSDITVCDLGCGQQDLRQYLHPSITYLPADIKQWTPDTAYCDLNSLELPHDYLQACDVCTLLGVLCYVSDPLKALKAITAFKKKIIFSVNPTEYSDFIHPVWKHKFSLTQLDPMVHECGYKIDQVIRMDDTALLIITPTV